MTIREKIRSLTAEAKELESRGVEEERAETYRGALRVERNTVTTHLARALSHPPDERELLSNPFVPEGAAVQAAKTWGQRAAELERRIKGIDNELERVSSA